MRSVEIICIESDGSSVVLSGQAVDLAILAFELAS